jgi:hypothetical protein
VTGFDLRAIEQHHRTLFAASAEDARQLGDPPARRDSIAMQLLDFGAKSALTGDPFALLSDRAVGDLAESAIFAAGRLFHCIQKHGREAAVAVVDQDDSVHAALESPSGEKGPRIPLPGWCI